MLTHLAAAHEKSVEFDVTPPLSYGIAKALAIFDGDIGDAVEDVKEWFAKHDDDPKCQGPKAAWGNHPPDAA